MDIKFGAISTSLTYGFVYINLALSQLSKIVKLKAMPDFWELLLS